MPVAYKHVQFQHNQVTQTVHVYLQTQDTSPVKHVLDINVNTKEIKYISVSFKDHYIYSNQYEGYYNTLINMAPGKDATALKSLLTMITKCNIISHVLFCTMDYQRHYSKINKTNQKFCLVKDFMSKLSNKSYAEATVAFKALYERVNSLGPDRQHINFQDKIRDILHIIDKNVKVFLKKEHDNLMKKINKQLESMFDVFTANDLVAVVTKCYRCPRMFTYHVQDNCNHNLCVNCAHKSSIDKRCVACAADANDSDGDFEEDDIGSDNSDEENDCPKPVNADDLSDDSFYDKFGNSPLMRKRRRSSSSSGLSAQESIEVNQAVQIIQRNIDDNAVTSDAFIERAVSRLSQKSSRRKSDASQHSNVSRNSNVSSNSDVSRNSDVSKHSNNKSNHDFDVEEQGANTRDCFDVEDASSLPAVTMNLSESLNVLTSKLDNLFDSKRTSPEPVADGDESAPTSPAPLQIESATLLQADSTTADLVASDSNTGKNIENSFTLDYTDFDHSVVENDKAIPIISETKAADKIAETLLATETIALMMSSTTTLTTTVAATTTPTTERCMTPDEINDVLEELCSSNKNDTAVVSPPVDAVELTQAVCGILDTTFLNDTAAVNDKDFLSTLENIKNEPGVDIVKLEPGDSSRAVDYYTYQVQHTTDEEPQVTIKLERDDDFFTDLSKLPPPPTSANNNDDDDDDDDCIMIEADELAFKPKKPIIKMKRVLTTLIDETEDTQSFVKRIRVENL
nr:hoar [Alphabaculovirus mabrassicae]